MKILVKDAFGADRGTAVVEWLPCEPVQTADGPLTQDDEVKLIFAPQLSVVLPTMDPRCPWQLEVEF